MPITGFPDHSAVVTLPNGEKRFFLYITQAFAFVRQQAQRHPQNPS
jgi:hypothetical protein